MICIRDFSKSYSDNLILSVPVLHFSTGVYWIRGHNGSGKSTFFNSLAGLIPCQGTIAFDDGISLKNHPIQYRKVVNYSEADPLYPGFLTAKDLCHFIAKAKGATVEDQVRIINKFGIDAYFEKPCSTYSSGMLKKLSLALAFLGQPRLIILDEPLITLDEAARKILYDCIQELLTTRPVTLIISSHQLLEDTPLEIKDSYNISNKTLIKI